jgi:hypothetical protein
LLRYQALAVISVKTIFLSTFKHQQPADTASKPHLRKCLDVSSDYLNTMKILTIFIVTLFFFAGCTIPCEIYFRNFSNETIKLQATLLDRNNFDKLPNRVSFYDSAKNKNHIYGDWKYQKLVTWIDSTTFFIEIPSKTIIDVKDISNGLTLGTMSPDIILIAVKSNGTDTITTGDYHSIADKFQQKKFLFAKPIYYYDLK